MSKLLQDIIERVRQWPEDRQNEAAAVLLELEAQRGAQVSLSPEQVAEIGRIRQREIDGTAEYVGDDEVEAFWKSCGL
jgi:hypothetical protein